jgi:hypothetical protein
MTTNETDQSAADKVKRAAFTDLLEAAKGVIAGFDSGVFVVRNVDHDHEPGSTVKAQPSLFALGNMVNAVKRAEEDVQAGGKKKHYENAPN